MKVVDSAFKAECPKRPLFVGSNAEDLIGWSRDLASLYDECVEKNASKIRAIQILEAEAGRV